MDRVIGVGLPVRPTYEVLTARTGGQKLQWWDEFGVGYLPFGPRAETMYDDSYFENYKNLQCTEMGAKLNKARVDLVNKYTTRACLDIGVGSGQFVFSRDPTYGYDINPVAVDMLKAAGLYLDPAVSPEVPAITFWDSIEHIPEPGFILNKAADFVFISCPIYENMAHVLRSKHLKPDEHCWYWTHEGLKWFMGRYGFTLKEHNTMESDLGRESVGTFVFETHSNEVSP